MTLLDDYSLSNQSFYEFFFELFPAIRDPEAVPSGLVLLPTLRGEILVSLLLGMIAL